MKKKNHVDLKANSNPTLTIRTITVYFQSEIHKGGIIISLKG